MKSRHDEMKSRPGEIISIFIQRRHVSASVHDRLMLPYIIHVKVQREDGIHVGISI